MTGDARTCCQRRGSRPCRFHLCLWWCRCLLELELELAKAVRESRDGLLREREVHGRRRDRCFWQSETPFRIVLVLAVVPTGVFRVHVVGIAMLVVAVATWGSVWMLAGEARRSGAGKA
jgi:hypothetical protein